MYICFLDIYYHMNNIIIWEFYSSDHKTNLRIIPTKIDL
jgi:hypothetical protein